MDEKNVKKVDKFVGFHIDNKETEDFLRKKIQALLDALDDIVWTGIAEQGQFDMYSMKKIRANAKNIMDLLNDFEDIDYKFDEDGKLIPCLVKLEEHNFPYDIITD